MGKSKLRNRRVANIKDIDSKVIYKVSGLEEELEERLQHIYVGNVMLKRVSLVLRTAILERSQENDFFRRNNLYLIRKCLVPSKSEREIVYERRIGPGFLNDILAELNRAY